MDELFLASSFDQSSHCCENRFSTEERAKFDQFHRKIYIIAEALPVVDVRVALLLLLPPYGPPPPPVVVEEPQAAMRSARARLIAEKRIVLECFICWILLCCFPGSLCGYNNDEVGHHGSLEERNAEMCFCCHVSPHTYTQKGYTRHRQSACSSQNTSACAKSILRCWASSLAWLGEGKSGRPSRLLRARGTLEELTCTPPWRGTLSGFSEKPLAQHAAELQHSNGDCMGHRAGTLTSRRASPFSARIVTQTSPAWVTKSP